MIQEDDEPGAGVVHRQFDTERTDPNVAVVESVAELERVSIDELSSLYDTVDHILDNIFSSPPSPTAQVQISFSYEGYRITINQDGSATFLKIQ